MVEDQRVEGAPDGTGSRERSQQAVSALSGFDPSRLADIAEQVARQQWGRDGHSLTRQALNAHPDGRIWRSSVAVSNGVWHKLARLGLVEGRCDASILTPLGRAVRDHLRQSDT